MLEGILARHPALHAAIAHFGFYSDNIERAAALMEKYPNLMMDMTPAPIIYYELSERQEEAKAFLLKYHDRLIYGTDVSNLIEGSVRELNERKTRIMDVFYEGSSACEVGDHVIVGMNLPSEMLENIYCNNAMRFIKEK